MNGFRGHNGQRGIAALTAMLVVVLATLLAVELIWDLNLNLRRTENLLAREQARQVALGLESLAATLLKRDYEQDPTVDSLNEDWAQEYGFPFEGGEVVGRLEDLQGRFNLNRLVRNNGARDPVAVDQFRRLVAQAGAELENNDVNVDAVVDSVIDWIDGNTLPELSGAEDGVYTGLKPPYRTANFWFTTPTELMAVNGVTPELYGQLRPLVSALPPESGESNRAARINVNTAKPEVLRALSPDITETAVGDWLSNREAQAYGAIVPDFWDGAAPYFPAETNGQPTNPESFLDVGSSYFGLTVIVSIGTTRLAMYSLFERSSQGIVTARLRAFDTD